MQWAIHVYQHFDEMPAIRNNLSMPLVELFRIFEQQKGELDNECGLKTCGIGRFIRTGGVISAASNCDSSFQNKFVHKTNKRSK